MDTPSSTLPPENAPKKSSGKKWALFGCGGCLGLMVLGGIAVFAIFTMVVGMIKNDDVYKTALQTVQNSPEVQASLGTPIKDSWFAMGSLNFNNGAGTAEISFPVEGPNGKGLTTLSATKAPGGTWEYSTLIVTVEGSGEVIDLLPAAP